MTSLMNDPLTGIPLGCRYQGPTLEDVFLELCLRDGDLETAKVREQRNSRTPIVKAKKTPNGELSLGKGSSII